MLSEDPPADLVLKRKACDECRSRKLACSKGPDGCSRCIREGIQCYYSQQKPMGRPRKRQRQEESGIKSAYQTSPKQESLPRLDNDSTLPTSPDTSAISIAAYTTEIYGVSDSAAHLVTDQHNATLNDEGRRIFHFASSNLDAIDFTTDEASAENEESMSPINLPVSIVDDAVSFSPSTATPCGCLAMMYLAMSSLQDSEFPVDIVSALAVVRAAANTAHAVTQCNICGSCIESNPNPSVSSFQNMMLLGTILPIIVNCYKRLLAMVDSETEAAVLSRTLKRFRLADYGGLNGLTSTCTHPDQWDNKEMSPGEWRTMIRALLRVDLYGHDPADTTYGMTGCNTGLRGLIAVLEQRQRSRHALLDEMRKAGLKEPGTPNFPGLTNEVTEEKNLVCMQIVGTAKRALDSLVIP